VSALLLGILGNLGWVFVVDLSRLAAVLDAARPNWLVLAPLEEFALVSHCLRAPPKESMKVASSPLA